jgi:hypothetical protein
MEEDKENKHPNQSFSNLKPLDSLSVLDSHNIFADNDKDVEIVKLQEDLATITTEWMNKSAQDISNLRKALLQTAKVERMRIARTETLMRVAENDKLGISQITPNLKFKNKLAFNFAIYCKYISIFSYI